MAAESSALTAAPVAAGHVREGGISNVVLGMSLFITSEVMFFAGLFAAYFNVRAQAPEWPPREFVGFLEWRPTAEEIIPVVTVATILLILSSVTCQMALRGIARGDHRALVRGIAVTFVLGATFIVMQAFDYLMLYSKGLRLRFRPIRDHVLHAHRLPRRARHRRAGHAGRGALPFDDRAVLGEAPRYGPRHGPLLGLRRHRLDRALLGAVHHPERGLRQGSMNHPIAHPRNAALVGVLFAVIGVAYAIGSKSWFGAVDMVGTTLFFALAISMGLAAWVLAAYSPRG